MATRRPRCFCVSKARPKASAGTDSPAASEAELRALGLKELRRRAKAAGMPASELEAAMDSDEPEASLIDFIVQARVQTDNTLGNGAGHAASEGATQAREGRRGGG